MLNRRTALQVPAVAALTMASLPATTPAQAEPSTLHIPGDVHLTATAGGGDVAHTIRRGDGTWYPFNLIPDPPRALYTIHLVSVIVNNEEHVMYYGYYRAAPPNETLRYVIRHADGSWTRTTPPPVAWISRIDLAAVAGRLHYVVHSENALEHRVRQVDGTWSAPSTVPATIDSAGVFAIAGAGDMLRLVTRSPSATSLSIYVRHADGRWGQGLDVPFAPPSGATAGRVDIAQVGTELHVVVIGQDGGLYHAVLRSDGSWTTFHDVASQAGPVGGTVDQVSITAARGALHVVIGTSAGRLLHTVRSGDGRWLPFGDVYDATTPGARYGQISIAGS